MNAIGYLKAARLRTLPLSVSGIIVGCFLAKSQNDFSWEIAVLAILTTIGFQIISNFANDYGDGIKGTDTNRVGEKRMVASGEISANQMKKAIIYASIITFSIALLLIYVSFGKENFIFSASFLILGIASIIAAITYTVGNSAYGYSGFGDVFVFIFFGLLSVLGSYFLFTKKMDALIFLPAISIGLLSTAVLNLNNMRDRKNDQKVGKNTVVVIFGATFSKYYHLCLITIALICACLYSIIQYVHPIQYLFCIAFIPLIKHLYTVFQNKEESTLDSELKKVALSTFLFAILFGLGQFLSLQIS